MAVLEGHKEEGLAQGKAAINTPKELAIECHSLSMPRSCHHREKAQSTPSISLRTLFLSKHKGKEVAFCLSSVLSQG